MELIDIKPARLLTIALVAAVIVSAGAVAYLAMSLPRNTPGPVIFPVAQFHFVIGSGRMQDGELVVDGFSDGYALLSSGPISIHAESAYLLQYSWNQPLNEEPPRFFWRRKSDSGSIAQRELWIEGNGVLDLSTDEDWRGEIIEIGLFIEEDNGRRVALGPLTLEAESLSDLLLREWRGWTAFEPWTMKSVNFLWGGEANPRLPLPLLVASWLIVGVSIIWLAPRTGPKRRRAALLLPAAVFFLAAWFLLDFRWLANHLGQVRLSITSTSSEARESLLFTRPDYELYRYIERLKAEVLGFKPLRVLVVGDEFDMSFFVLAKAKYHLAPHSVHVARELGRAFKPSRMDYFVYFGEPEKFNQLPGWSPIYDSELEEVYRSEFGVVYRSLSRVTAP